MSTKTELLNLAKQLPTGLEDKRALGKFAREEQELRDAILVGDTVGALLEAADCWYYAVKAEWNNLLSDQEVDARMREVRRRSGFSQQQIEQVALRKYTLRARPGNPKNDAEERAAAEALL